MNKITDGLSDIMTETKSDDIWEDDLLGRSSDARTIIDFLSGRITELSAAEKPASYVLNLDARWGDGKSFFMTRLAKQLECEDYLVAYVNAWESDFSEDPLIPVMAGIKSAIGGFIVKPKGKTLFKEVTRNGAAIAVGAVNGIVKTAFKRYVGEGIDDLVGGADENEIIEVTTDQAIDSVTCPSSKIYGQMAA